MWLTRASSVFCNSTLLNTLSHTALDPAHNLVLEHPLEILTIRSARFPIVSKKSENVGLE